MTDSLPSNKLQEKVASLENEKTEKNLIPKDFTEQRQMLENKRFENDTEYRNKLSNWVQNVTNYYLLAVFVIILFSQFRFIYLSDTILITLLGSTTATVLGLPLIVLKGMFKVKE